MKASEIASKKAGAAVDSFLAGMEDVPVRELDEFDDLASATGDELDVMARQQAKYLEELQKQQGNLDGIIDTYHDMDDAGTKTVKVLADVTSAVRLFDHPLDDLKDRLEQAGQEISVVEKNLELLNSARVREGAIIRELISGMDERIATTRDMLELEQASVDALQDRADAAQLDMQAIEQSLSQDVMRAFEDGLSGAATSGLAILQHSFERTGDEFEDMATTLSLVLAKVDDLTESDIEFIGAFLERAEQRRELQELINSINDQYLPAAEIRQAESDAIEEQNALLEQSRERRRQEADALREQLRQVTASLKQAETDYASYVLTEQLETMRQARRDSQENALLAQIEAAKAEEAQADRLADIRATRAEYAQRETELLAEQAEDRREVVEDYEQWRLGAEEDLAAKLRSINDDLSDDLLDAQLANDVNAAIQAQKQAVKDREQAEDEHAQELVERKQQADERLAELDKEGREQLAELRQQGQEKLKALQASGQQEIKESQRLQAQLTELREKWAQEDAASRKAAEIQGYQERLNELRRHQQELQRQTSLGYQIEQQMAVNFANTATQAAQRVASAIGLINRAALPAKSSSLDLIRRRKMDDGGVISLDRPTDVRFGPKPGYSEAFVPFRNSEGLDRALARLGNRTVNASINIGSMGDSVSRGELNRVVNRVQQGLMDAILRAEEIAMRENM